MKDDCPTCPYLRTRIACVVAGLRTLARTKGKHTRTHLEEVVGRVDHALGLVTQAGEMCEAVDCRAEVGRLPHRQKDHLACARSGRHIVFRQHALAGSGDLGQRSAREDGCTRTMHGRRRLAIWGWIVFS